MDPIRESYIKRLKEVKRHKPLCVDCSVPDMIECLKQTGSQIEYMSELCNREIQILCSGAEEYNKPLRFKCVYPEEFDFKIFENNKKIDEYSNDSLFEELNNVKLDKNYCLGRRHQRQ
jgi:hypothetical protein